ncbi:unnamed protein product [Tilletia controversa]|nr:unnamed protein product [Tilletia controversa]
MSRRIYVGRLPPNVQRADFDDLFEKYGKLVDVRIMGQFGFVEFDSSREADDAVRALNGHEWRGFSSSLPKNPVVAMAAAPPELAAPPTERHPNAPSAEDSSA